MSFEVHNMKRGTSFLQKQKNTIGVCNEYFVIAKPPLPQKKKENEEKNVWKTEILLCGNIAKQILFIDR